jgi:hypothetical protein
MDLSRHAGSFIHQIGQLAKYAFYYVISCGDLNFLSEESRSRHHHTGDEPPLTSTEEALASFVNTSSYNGAITSLYAGTTPQAGELNGKVGIRTLRIIACGSLAYV